jgi:F-type H+-transporting ATPase subunit c
MLQSAKLIGAGLASAGLGGAGVGIGIVFGSFINATARNPSLRSTLFSTTILGFAMVEAMGLFSIMLSFMLLYS